jgi:hypothetical protein
MTTTSRIMYSLAIWCALIAARLASAGPGDHTCPSCAGQVVYRDVVSHRCRLVTERKPVKKTVYEVQEVPFCLHKLPPLLGHTRACDECVACDCVRYKRILVKKEVVCDEVTTTRCVVEEFVESVPCRVCSPGCPNCAQPALAPRQTAKSADQELISLPLPRLSAPSY